MKEERLREPRRLRRADNGHLVGNPWIVQRMFEWTLTNISSSVLVIDLSSGPYRVIEPRVKCPSYAIDDSFNRLRLCRSRSTCDLLSLSSAVSSLLLSL